MTQLDAFAEDHALVFHRIADNETAGSMIVLICTVTGLVVWCLGISAVVVLLLSWLIARLRARAGRNSTFHVKR